MLRALFRFAPLRAVLLLFAAAFVLGGCASLRASRSACRWSGSIRSSGKGSRCASA